MPFIPIFFDINIYLYLLSIYFNIMVLNAHVLYICRVYHSFGISNKGSINSLIMLENAIKECVL